MSFCGVPTRKLPPAGLSFAMPAGLETAELLQSIAAAAGQLASGDAPPPPLQRKNSRSLLHRIKVLLCLADTIAVSGDLSASAELCLKELYVVTHRAKALLDYCSGIGTLWLLLQGSAVSRHFYDLNQDISTIIDVLLPLSSTPSEMRDQLRLLRRQCRRARICEDPSDEALHGRVLSFLEAFENGDSPAASELRETFVGRLRICDAASCCAEIEFLENLMIDVQDHGGVGAESCCIGGVVALLRYSRFLLFGLDGEEGDGGGEAEKKGGSFGITEHPPPARKEGSLECCDQSPAIPKDFLCPISLDLMKDPVIAASGQTYDRESIARWIEAGHLSCPNSGQRLADARLVPNRALRSLISLWCAANGVPFAFADEHAITIAGASSSIAVKLNRATARLLVHQMSIGPKSARFVAARELRLLSKTGTANRSAIADAGAIPLLHPLLRSPDAAAQCNSITAILNLSIDVDNKRLIMDETGCLGSIVDVLRIGATTEARENAAAALFSLSAVHDYKRRIAGEDGAVSALSAMLMEEEGSSTTARGKRDAVMALLNLSTHAMNGRRMMEGGAVAALGRAVEVDDVAEAAAGALAMLARWQEAAEMVGRDDVAMAGLVRLIRRGSPGAKENAVAALSEMCRSGVAELTRRVARAPALGGMIQMLLFTGTKRARRKAASLAWLCRRCGDGDGEGVTQCVTAAESGDSAGAGDVAAGGVAASLPEPALPAIFEP